MYTIPTTNALQSNLTASLSAGETTSFAIDADWSSYLSDLSASRPLVLVIDRINTSGASTPSAKEYVSVTGASGGAGTTFTTITRGVGGTTAVAHSTGAIVEVVIDATTMKSITDGILVQHNADGTHKADTVTTLKATSAQITAGTVDTAVITPKGLKDAGIVAGTALSKASGAEVTTGTDDAKYVTPKAIADAGLVLDNDTALTANSDLKIATQKATKAHVLATKNYIANDTFLYGRNQANNADVGIAKINTSNQVVVGANAVRPTRFVAVADPSGWHYSSGTGAAKTNWTDVDVSSVTSTRTFAIQYRYLFKQANGSERFVEVMQKGEGAGAYDYNRHDVRDNSTGYGGTGVVEVDTNRVFQYRQDTAGGTDNATFYNFVVIGYYEYLD